MVCQAASQTRFRAHKHENGIAGRTTIIVVIACFQPLQNCQAEYFQYPKVIIFAGLNTIVCSFGYIITAKRVSQMSQQFLKSNNLDQMARAQLDQNYKLPYFNSSTLTTNVAFEGQINSDLRVGEFFKLPCPYGNIPYPTENPCFKNSQIALPHSGVRVSDNKLIDASWSLQEKKFLIFDRSGNHTRLFFSPSFSPQNQVIASSAQKVVPQIEEQFLSNPLIEEKWDENDLNDGEDEMLEDSEEIDALLYSSTDDDDEYDDEDNDEVTSTMHVPFGTEEGSPKRQRLLDGGYNKSSLLSFECPTDQAGSCNYNGINSTERGKKVKIRETLKMLESIIPGSKSNKDPVSIIEKAIAYLESMRIKAEALGLTGPKRKSTNHS
ncbi:hypothetical protein CASFOL_038845 [Castilleja foliolosa]|uniref:BHLH domain-containing protein n=1 Tax=Castilleja foliolosa TaxID=1961234 RepID=A0ABD3BIQ2_9LAMI